ncbi:MAG TPA: hypothetical protein DET40_18270 [Lentisphaeria bacterium]|nr:MAG: hypothetical protein A2X45_14410 [Lentisphaerae bacterium GWF2_50_93]HCE45490.1 hypothetical protein [Lentisphaeria bacterium]
MRALLRIGQTEFENWIISLGDNPSSSIPNYLLSSDEFSYEIIGSPNISDINFPKKYELSEYLLPKIIELENLSINHESWSGIWDSLALFYFKSICPVDEDGKWLPNRIEHYIYSSDYRYRHRHRIYGPLTLYRSAKEHVRPFFQKEPYVLGEYEEQIGSRQEIAGNPTALQVIKNLYIKNGADDILSGYTSSKKYRGINKKLPAPGTIRRFYTIYPQLSRTYDLPGISCDGFIKLLPKEFSEWLKK